MPIKGWSETKRNPRGGKFRLGEKNVTQGGKEYPAKIDYFRFDPDDPTLIPEFTAVYGEKPRKLNVMLIDEDAERVLHETLASYRTGGVLFCRGDGEAAFRLAETDGKVTVDGDGRPAYQEMRCSYKDCPVYKKGKCKELGRLQFILTDFHSMTVWQIDTSSWNSMQNVRARLEQLKSMAGRITRIPLQLVLKPHDGTYIDESGKVRGTQVFVLDIVHPFTFQELVAQGQKALGVNLELPAPATTPAPDEAMPSDLYVEHELVGADADPEEAARKAAGDAFDRYLDEAMQKGSHAEPEPEDPFVKLKRLTDEARLTAAQSMRLMTKAGGDPELAIEILENMKLQAAVEPKPEPKPEVVAMRATGTPQANTAAARPKRSSAF